MTMNSTRILASIWTARYRKYPTDSGGKTQGRHHGAPFCFSLCRVFEYGHGERSSR